MSDKKRKNTPEDESAKEAKARKNRKKLDILSGIDDDIIERNTIKRFTLMSLIKKIPIWQKKSFIVSAAAACLAFIFLGTFLTMQLLTPTPPDEKQVPIYQGMSLSSEVPSFIRGDKEMISIQTLSSPNMAMSATSLASENQDGTTESIVKDSLTITGGLKDIYYTRPNEDIYVTIHISNPDSFEILSFTLNGQKYSSYMFEEGSTMENLVLKVNVGDTSGIIHYTIDAIKYIDGTEIKDVRMEGDQTVKAGVYTEDQPRADITDMSIGFNHISFNVKIEDVNSLISQCDGFVQAVIFEGENIIYVKDVPLGETVEVRVDGLTTGSPYKYAIVAVYDSLDGSGMNVYSIAESDFSTETILSIVDVSTAKDGASFSVSWSDNFADKTISSLVLYKDGSAVRQLDPAAVNISDLLSDTEYTLVASYYNGEALETVEMTFRTEAKAVPTIEITDLTAGYREISAVISENDPDEVGQIIKSEILKGDTVVATVEGNDELKFEDLLSSSEYTFRLTYAYDLNDGRGAQVIEEIRPVTTKSYTVPTLAVSTVVSTQSSFSFSAQISDPSGVGAIASIELLDSNGLVIRAADSTEVRMFNGLLSNTLYGVRVTYEYDLKDGSGAHTLSKDAFIKTKATPIPTATLTKGSVTESSFSFVFKELDDLSVGEATKINLLDANKNLLRTAENVNVRSFDGLISMTDYIVELIYTYDLNDGHGPHNISVLLPFRTDPLPNVQYVVNHYTEKLEDGEYTLADTETFYTDEGTLISPATKTYTGFDTPKTVSRVVPKDGSLVIDYYYARRSHTVKLHTGQGVAMDDLIVKYGETLSLPTPVHELYTFEYWYSKTSKTIPETMPDNDLTFYAKWKEESDPFLFSIYSNGVLSAYRGTEATVNVPAYIGDIPVNVVGAGCSWSNSVITVRLPSTIKHLEWNSFASPNISTLFIPDSLISSEYVIFGEESQYQDTKTIYLGHTSLPQGFPLETYTDNISTYLDAYFWDTATDENGIGYWLYAGNKAAVTYVPTSLTEITSLGIEGYELYCIGKNAFAGSNVKSLVLPEGITVIKSGAFMGSALTQITLPSTLTTIGDKAFADTKLSAITLPDSVSDLGTGIFSNCTKLSSAVLGKNITEIPNEMFYNCALTSITLPPSLTKIGNDAFAENEFTSFNIPEGVTELGNYAFDNCYELQNVTIPSTLKVIPAGAFSDCPLSDFVLPSHIEVIGQYAFEYCDFTEMTLPKNIQTMSQAFYYSSVKNVIVPEGVKTIPKEAFMYCYSLESISLPSTLTTIDRDAFVECKNLNYIYLPKSVTTVAKGIFSGITAINVSAEVAQRPMSWPTDSEWGAESITFTWNVSPEQGGETTPSLYVKDGVTYKVDENGNAKVISYDPGTGRHSVTVSLDGFTVTEIADGVFAGDAELERIYLRDGLEKIGANAFGDLWLDMLDIPSSVKYIGEGAVDYRVEVRTALASKPEGWHDNWNGGGSNVIWNYDPIGNSFNYQAIDGGYTITGYTGVPYDITIPESINGLPVVSVSDSAFRNVEVYSLTFPGSVNISHELINSLTSLKYISIISNDPYAAIANDSNWTAIY